MIATKKFFGANRAEIFDGLVQWLSDGPNVCIVEGFAGTGKTSLAGALMRRVSVEHAWRGAIPVAMTEEASVIDLLLTVAAHLSDDGMPDVEKALFDVPEPNYAFVMGRALREYVLIVVDEAQFLFDAATGRPAADLVPILASFASRGNFPGRLLLLSNRLVDRTAWPDIPVLTLRDLAADEAEALLDDRLALAGIPDAIPPERRQDILTALAHNPRAIEMLATALRYEPLEKIVGQRPDLWDVHDREFSRDFLEDLERMLLVRIIDRLPSPVQRRLFRLSVYRQDFEHDAIDRACDQPSDARELRTLLIDRFLLAHSFSRYSLNPLVREIALARLKASPSLLRKAHKSAADYYLRYFGARRIVTPSDRLKGSFAELRYHLIQADRTKELEEISRRYSDHLKLEMVRKPLTAGAELDDRIRLLSAVLERPGGPEALEYHLARCLESRGGAGDLEQAIIHAERATTPGMPPAFWTLRARLEAPADPEAAIATLRRGITNNPAAMQLYDASIALLLKADRVDDAVALLSEAKDHVGPGEAADETYGACARALCNSGRTAEAIAMLKGGSESPAAERGATLYAFYARLVSAAGRDEEAIAILRKGLKQVPPHHTLYVQGADVLQRLGRFAEAEALLRSGLESVSKSSYHALYYRLGELLRDGGRVDAALAVLREGFAVTPPESVEALYVLASDILDHAQQLPAAIELLREAATLVPVTSIRGIYQSLARKIARHSDPHDAIEVLREGQRRTQDWEATADNLGQIALGTCVALQDWVTFDDILRNDIISERVKIYGEILRLNARGEYAAAARVSAPEGRSVFATAQAFALLCIGAAEEAWQRIESVAERGMPDDSEALSTSSHSQRQYAFRRGDVRAWLTAFIQLRRGRIDEAAGAIAVLLGRPVAPREVNEATLLRYWDGELDDDAVIASYFPVLPPSLTGRPAPVYRRPFGRPQMAEPPAAAQAYEEALQYLRARVTAEGRRTGVSCFISYAWGNLQHQAWVRRLDTDLEAAGIEVIVDYKSNSFIGASATRYVDRIATADFVVIVGTPLYVEKYRNLDGHVVAAEFDSIAERLIGTEEQKSSVLPIILEGTRKTAIPLGLANTRVAGDFTVPADYRVNLLHLVRSMWRIVPDSVFFDLEARVRPALRSAS